MAGIPAAVPKRVRQLLHTHSKLLFTLLLSGCMAGTSSSDLSSSFSGQKEGSSEEQTDDGKGEADGSVGGSAADPTFGHAQDTFLSAVVPLFEEGAGGCVACHSAGGGAPQFLEADAMYESVTTWPQLVLLGGQSSVSMLLNKGEHGGKNPQTGEYNAQPWSTDEENIILAWLEEETQGS